MRRALVSVTLSATLAGTMALAGLPASSQEMTAPDGAVVMVSASPRWARSMPGAWTPYEVKVTNDRAGDIEGELVLVPEADPPPGYELRGAPGSTPGSRAIPFGKFLGPDLILGGAQGGQMGGTPVVVPTGPGVAFGPKDMPVHRTSLSLAAGEQKTLSMVVVEAPYGYRAEVRDKKGRTLAASVVPPEDGRALRVAILSQVPGAAQVLETLEVLGPDLRAYAMRSSREVPDSFSQLNGLDAIVIDDFDTGALSRDQIVALQDFVAFGGDLVLAGGASGARSVSPLPDQLVPLRPSATELAPLAALADLGATSTSSHATVVTGQVQRGLVVLQANAGMPLVLQAEYGAGRVVQMTYDPLAEPLASDRVLRLLGWDQALRRATDRWNLSGGGAPRLAGPIRQLWLPTLERPAWPGWPSLGLWLLVGYALLVGPLSWMLLFRNRSPATSWSFLTCGAALVSITAVLAAQARPGEQHREVHVVISGPHGAALATSYHGLADFGGGKLPMTAPAGTAASTLLAPPTEHYFGARDLRLRLHDLLERGGGGGTVIATTEGPEVRTSARHPTSVALQSVAHGSPGLEARIRLVAPASAPPQLFGKLREGTRVVGTVTNHTSEPVRRLRAQLVEGNQAALAEVVAAGQTLEVDAPLLELSHLDPRAVVQPEELVLFAAAARAMAGSGQVAVAGLGPDRLTQPTSTRTSGQSGRINVLVQAVPLEAAEHVTALSAAGYRSTSFLPTGPASWINTYEVGGVPLMGAVDLVHREYGPPVPLEVYNWSSATWRVVPAKPRSHLPRTLISDPTRREPLTDQEVNHGLVRIRARESGDSLLSSPMLVLRGAPAQ